jgi:hypothetical protein
VSYVGDVKYVWATRPDQPNHSENARGRVLHIPRHRSDKKFNFEATYCGMLVVKKADPFDCNGRRRCIPCVQLEAKENAKQKPWQLQHCPSIMRGDRCETCKGLFPAWERGTGYPHQCVRCRQREVARDRDKKGSGEPDMARY